MESGGEQPENAVGCSALAGNDPHEFAAQPGHVDRVDDRLDLEVIRDRPANAAAGKDGGHRRAADLFSGHSTVRDVLHPKLAETISGEHPPDTPFDNRGQPAHPTAAPRYVVKALQPRPPPQPFNTAETDTMRAARGAACAPQIPFVRHLTAPNTRIVLIILTVRKRRHNVAKIRRW